MHVLPRAAELEERFGDDLVVIGVHSGKFVEERRTPNIRQACARLGVHHPVVNDRHYRVWRAYAVNAWPTVALLTPDGYVVGVQPGEFEVRPMADVIGGLIGRYRREGLLTPGPLDFGRDPEALPEPAGVLRFPSRVIGHEGRLYVSDTGHHRVLELSPEGTAEASVTRVFGDGVDGFRDGAASEARFREPLGLAVSGGMLYVADRRSHAVRAISLDDGSVATVAGTGELGDYRMAEGLPGLQTALRSPWGLAADGGTVYVAMAGSHQVWSVDLGDAEHRMALVAGSGGESVGDGPAREATLAQTSGFALDGERLYFADAESSAVRWVTTGPDAEVGTVVGTGLFEFGDRDGEGDRVLLQHDLDLALLGESLLVADTYNSKLKRVDPGTRRCRALPGAAGSGEALYEPGGVWSGPEGVFVADTNHHRVARVDLATGELTELAVHARDRSGAGVD
jgi:hypothetical protein